MKMLSFTFLLLLMCFHSVAQEFSFPIFFEDAIGNKDTIIVGHDSLGSLAIQEEFGEVDILGTTYDSVFEVRTAIYEYDDVACFDNNDPRLAESRQMIVKNTCYDLDYFDEAESIMAVIKCQNLPFTVSWDATIFTDTCQWVRIVDWAPGGWFDACCCNGASITDLMHTLSSATFISTDYIIHTPQDTFFTLFFPFEGDKTVRLDESNTPNEVFRLFPNPTSNYLEIEFPENNTRERDRMEIVFFDIHGREVFTSKLSSHRIDIRECKPGLYFYQIRENNRAIYQNKVIVN